MKKITTILILALTSLFANAQDIQMAPGSMLSIYQLQRGQTFWNQGQEPMNTIIDRTQSFHLGEALAMNNETKSLVRKSSVYTLAQPHLANVWYGFIEIKEAGVYVFSLQDITNGMGKSTVYINNKPYMVTDNTSHTNKTTSATKTLKLDPGFYKIDLLIARPSTNAAPVIPTLTYWNKLSPTNKTAITPATMMLKRK